MHPAALIHALRTQSPVYLTVRVLDRLGLRSRWQRRAKFLHAPTVRDPCRSPRILTNALSQAGVSTERLVTALHGAAVAEIGCGPHAGLAAFCAAAGARRYIGVDPSLDAPLFAETAAQRRYLTPSLKANAAFFRDMPGAGSSTASDLSQLRGILDLRNGGAETVLTAADSLDVCVSISCLEHILDFPAAAAALSAACKPGALHAHIVNFSNHLSKTAPFEPLYEAPFDRFTGRWGPIINGLRAPDIERAVAEAGLPLRFIPLDRRPDALPARIDASWTESYDRETLALRTGLLTNLPPAATPDRTG
jgi:hypothetical protein